MFGIDAFCHWDHWEACRGPLNRRYECQSHHDTTRTNAAELYCIDRGDELPQDKAACLRRYTKNQLWRLHCMKRVLGI